MLRTGSELPDVTASTGTVVLFTFTSLAFDGNTTEPGPWCENLPLLLPSFVLLLLLPAIILCSVPCVVHPGPNKVVQITSHCDRCLALRLQLQDFASSTSTSFDQLTDELPVHIYTHTHPHQSTNQQRTIIRSSQLPSWKQHPAAASSAAVSPWPQKT